MMRRMIVVMILAILIAAGTPLLRGAVWAQEEKKAPEPKAQCPKTLVVGAVDACLKCHVAPSFKLRETAPDACYVYPNINTRIIDGVGHYAMEGMIASGTASEIHDTLLYLQGHKIKQLIVEIHSGGGSLFAAQKIVGELLKFQAEGGIVETRVQGFAASAAFQIFAAGTIGHRRVCAEAELMWHELLNAKMFDISTPSDKEEEARVLRHLQDTRNTWLASRSKLSKADLDAKVAKKEFWMRGPQAKEHGFADGFLSK